VQLDPELVTAKEYPTRFQTVLAAGTPPDVVLSRHEVQTRWYDAGVHLDMTNLVARDEIKLRRDYALRGTELWCGKTFGLPMNADANAVFCNKTLLARLGLKDPWSINKGDWTLDDLATLAKQATQDADRDGANDQCGLWMEYTPPSHIGQFVWTRGGDIADLQQMRYTLDNPSSSDAIKRGVDPILKDAQASGQLACTAGK
jgi:ABC-type glycerol-3-phosphate transport system substrate-binding protein